jgi:hypothetical protein
MPRLRRSPGLIVAIVALVAALAGTAVAVGGLTGKQRKQVRKIATKVFNRNIGGASVAHANTADSAKTANSAKTATTATTANTANTAKKATDADKLGGLPASKYQQALQGSCPKNGAYNSIGSEGAAACVVPVVPIVIQHPANTPIMGVSAGAGLEVRSVCHDGATVEVIFRNAGSSQGTLNWFYANAKNEVNANGAVLNSGSEQLFPYPASRIEGQFIWSVGEQVVTVNLHAFDGTNFCEIRGTAEGASA